MLGIGLIGAGARGWSLGQCVADHPSRARLSAVVDPVVSHREAFGEAHSILPMHRFAGHTGLLQRCGDLDGVIVTTPVPSHADIASACLEAGIPVFLDKPMALDLTEARRLVTTAERNGTPLHVGFNCRHAPFFRVVKQVVAENRLGTVVSVEWKEALSLSLGRVLSVPDVQPARCGRELVAGEMLSRHRFTQLDCRRPVRASSLVREPISFHAAARCPGALLP